jgi:hypothetical protein
MKALVDFIKDIYVEYGILSIFSIFSMFCCVCISIKFIFECIIEMIKDLRDNNKSLDGTQREKESCSCCRGRGAVDLCTECRYIFYHLQDIQDSQDDFDAYREDKYTNEYENKYYEYSSYDYDNYNRNRHNIEPDCERCENKVLKFNPQVECPKCHGTGLQLEPAHT